MSESLWGARPASGGSRRRRAFTLIELLVVVSIISLLIGILLPTLGSALKQAREVVCATTQKGLMDGMIAWSLENKDEIPGASTSSAARLRTNNPIITAGKDPAIPVQVTDWMSPALGGEGLPTSRAARFQYLLERFRCPEMNTQTTIFPGGDSGVMEAEEYIQRSGLEVFGTSYLMSCAWQSTSGTARFSQVGEFPNVRLSISTIGEASNERQRITLPSGFTPKFTTIGNPGLKGAFADGFRYVTNADQGYATDVDFSHLAESLSPHYSTFTESFSFVNSTAYGEDRGGVNKRLSFRHNDGVNTAFFDGHVGGLKQSEFWNPTHWYPSGSRVVGGTIHPKALEYYEVGDVIN